MFIPFHFDNRMAHFYILPWIAWLAFDWIFIAKKEREHFKCMTCFLHAMGINLPSIHFYLFIVKINILQSFACRKVKFIHQEYSQWIHFFLLLVSMIIIIKYNSMNMYENISYSKCMWKNILTCIQNHFVWCFTLKPV